MLEILEGNTRVGSREDVHKHKQRGSESPDTFKLHVQRHLPIPFRSERAAKAELLMPRSRHRKHKTDLLKHQKTVTAEGGTPFKRQ